jgi:hypothetical protein
MPLVALPVEACGVQKEPLSVIAAAGPGTPHTDPCSTVMLLAEAALL